MPDLLINAAASLSRRLPPIRGRARIALILQDRITPRASSWTVQMSRGHTMDVPKNSAQSWRAAFTGTYDDAEIELLIPYIEPGSLVLDVGASLGFYTIPLAFAAKAVGARVVAIEPVSRNCEIIRRNIVLNRLQEVANVVQCGLGAAHGTATVHIERGGTGNAAIVSGLDSLEVERHDKAGNTGDVEVIQVKPLDDLDLSPSDRDRPCSLMKLDTEGFEMEILSGATAFVAKHRPTMLGEFSPQWLETRGFSASAPAEWAVTNQYVCREVVHARGNPMLEAREVSLRHWTDAKERTGSDLMLVPDGGVQRTSDRRT